jgi:uncharacterized protein
VRWYRKAADQGDPRGQHNLGTMYRDGQGVAQDYTEAVNWFRKAADRVTHLPNTVSRTCTTPAGAWWRTMRGVKMDRKAAEQGWARAQFNLGSMYENGQGLTQDHTQAVKWYCKAAEQGDVHAQFRLGVMYHIGQGAAGDDDEAAKWYHRAADQGHAPSQFGLGIMYDTGRGWFRTWQAHRWFSLAAVCFQASENKFRSEALSARDRVASKMTSTQISEAQRLASEWKPNTPGAQAMVSPASHLFERCGEPFRIKMLTHMLLILQYN